MFCPPFPRLFNHHRRTFQLANRRFLIIPEAQHPWHDGGGERGAAPPGDGAALAGREEVPSRSGARRRGLYQTVSDCVSIRVIAFIRSPYW